MLVRVLLCAMLAAGSLPAASAGLVPNARGAGLVEGRPVAFEIVDGWAVVEGDIILGRAEELARALNRPADQPDAKGFAIGYQSTLWPAGPSGAFEVPYTVESDPAGNVPAAIAAFNAYFPGFLQFVPRTTQADYVAFVLNLPDSTPACMSALGRSGGRQVISGPPACRVGTLLHEMGHAIGLQHEQSRPDRDQYIAWQSGNQAKALRANSTPETFNRKTVAPYDFASIMHYDDFTFSGNGLPTHVTIPPGIEIGQRQQYSTADLDAVRRLYGSAPTEVTITSLPPGLQLSVDGEVVTTPRTFAWAIGSTHTIDVPGPTQMLSSVPYVFGRWNVDVAGDNAPSRNVRVDPGTDAVGVPAQAPAVTVYTANFVRLFPFALTVGGDTAAARSATTASVSPLPQGYAGLPDTYFRANELVTLSAQVGAGFNFGGWFGTNVTAIQDGNSADTLTVYPFDFGTAFDMRAQAYASQAPVVRLRGRGTDGVVDGFTFMIDSTTRRSPVTSVYAPLTAAGAHLLQAPSPQFRNRSTTRYRFTDWDGVAVNPISVSKPDASQPSRDVAANFVAQQLVTLQQLSPACVGTAAITGAAADDYYDHGSVVTATAAPRPGWTFTGWMGDLTGTAATQSISVQGEMLATPTFNSSPEPFAVNGASRLFAKANSPGIELTVFGSGFTPATRVFVNFLSRPATFVDSQRMRVMLTANDLAVPGELRVSAGNVVAGCQHLGVTSVAVQGPAFDWPATVPVVEFYNAALDHYFITANPGEMAKLDDGTFKGWQRTQQSFKAFPPESWALAAGLARVVCRFYGNPAAGLDSHFYSATKDECDDVKRKFPDSWIFESADVFQAVVPDRLTGECPDGTIPVYRLFNQRADANHRYTTDLAIRAQMIAKGYVPEGYGPLGVALCALT
jgi:uncharacterized repeat protein (TIGR02543 family)